MPIYLEPRDIVDDVKDSRSVLIVSCPICPAMSLAMRTKRPFIDLFRHGLKTGAFEDYVRSIRELLEQRSIRTDVYTTRVPSPLMCLWTEGQRRRLVERAKGHDTILVLGCNSATDTVKDTLKDTDCQVFQAMRMRAIANATMKVRFPMKVELDMQPRRKKRGVRRHADAADAATEREKEES